MSDQPANITLKLALDQAALNQGAAGVDKLQKELTDLRASLNDTGQSGDKAASNIGQAMADVSDGAADATKQVQQLNSALETTSQTAARVKSGGFGVEGLRRTGGALTQLGLGDIGAPVQKIGDLGQVIKEVGTISEATTPLLGSVTVAFAGMELTLSPLLLVLGAVALAVIDLKMVLDLIKKSTDDAVASQKAKFDQDQAEAEQARQNRDKSRSTSTEQNQQFVNDTFGDAADLQKRINDKKAEIAKNQSEYDALGASFNPAERSRLAGVGGELKKELETLETQQNTFFSQSENAAKNLQPLIDKVEAQKKAEDDLLKTSDDLIKTRQQEQQDLQLTSKAVQDKLAALKSEQAATEDARDKLEKSGDTSKAVQDKIAGYTAALTDNANEQKYLTDTAIPLIKAREDEAQKIKDTTKALADQAKAGDDYEKAVTAENDTRAKNAETIQNIEDSTNQQRADLEQSYADKRVDIARKAVQTAQDELTKLQQKQDDLLTGLNRNLSADAAAEQNKILDLQINYQRQAVQDTQDHYQKLADIQRNAQQSDQDALLNRNFRQLFQNKQQTSNAIDAENQRYQQQEQQRIVALNQQKDDASRAAAQQRQQRIVAYNQALADAQLAYQRQEQQDALSKQRQLQEAQIANQRAESALTTKENRTLAIQEQSYKNQLQLLEQTELEKLQILKNAQAATAALMGSSTSGIGAGGRSATATPFAAGGKISAFQAAIVQEPGSSGREGFNGVPFPPGQGLFMPFRAGNINPNMPGQTTHTTGPISIVIQEANNPRETEAAVYRALKKVVA